MDFFNFIGVGNWSFLNCYFKALSLGEVSKVAAVDKSSAILSVLLAIILFSYFVFHEKLSMKSFNGLLLLIVGTVCMAIFT